MRERNRKKELAVGEGRALERLRRAVSLRGEASSLMLRLRGLFIERNKEEIELESKKNKQNQVKIKFCCL